MLDMLIQGGRVVTPAGVGNWDVGIVGEQIVAVAFPGILPGTATRTQTIPPTVFTPAVIPPTRSPAIRISSRRVSPASKSLPPTFDLPKGARRA